MAADMFPKIKHVAGESRDKAHGKQIDVLSWSWGTSNSGSAYVRGGSGASKVNVRDGGITNYADSSSPKLLLACYNGTHFYSALLTLDKAGGSAVLIPHWRIR